MSENNKNYIYVIMNKKTFNTKETKNVIKDYVDGGLSCSNIGFITKKDLKIK